MEYKYTKYTVVAWLYDKRCSNNCRLTSYDTDNYEDAIKWIGKIKKAHGDSVKLIDREDDTTKHILLRPDQLLIKIN